MNPSLLRGVLAALLLASPLARAACSVSVGALSFGLYDPTNPRPADTSTQMEILCGPGEGNRLRLSWTQPEPSGASRFRYRLYQDAARTRPWGQGSQARLVSVDQTGRLRLPVYARAPAGQWVHPQAYVDQPVATLEDAP